MKKRLKMLRYIVFVVLVTAIPSRASSAAKIGGETRKWHKVTLTFDGPETGEEADPNPAVLVPVVACQSNLPSKL